MIPDRRSRWADRLTRAARWWRYGVDCIRIIASTWRARWLGPGVAAPAGGTAPMPSLHMVVPPASAEEVLPLRRHDGPLRASVVIPVYNHLDQTRRCLLSLMRHGARCRFEVIVVDDGSCDGSAQWLADQVDVRVHRMPTNSGFVAACNAGASLAQGEYLVFLNNDTEVSAGWLDELLATFDTTPQCGLVGAKLIYPDGSLQEAGGIVFADGEACNYGRGGVPGDPRYDFLREADYCSGACIAVPVTLFRALGGFDPRYAPAYYEDTDLAFAIRAAGYRVVYQPRAQVVHHEGKTSGTDIARGVKRFQAINRLKFVDKWSTTLAAQPRAQDFGRFPSRCATHRSRWRVLVVDADFPHAQRDSGSLRMFSLLLLLRELGCHVQFWATGVAERDDDARQLERHGVEIIIAPTRRQALRWWREHGDEPDMVLLSRLPVALANLRLVRRYARSAKAVFDTVDLHFLRIERGAALSGNQQQATWAAQLRKSELGLVRRADLTLVVSDYEKNLLQLLVPGEDVRVLSNVHPVHGLQAPFGQRSGLLFLGNFEHEPNVDAARWLVSEIMPRLRKHLPHVTLHIVGYAGTSALADCAAADVLVHGFIDDLQPMLRQVKLALAPLRYGAGVKGKINMAMSYGLPTVTTSIGAEGMALVQRRDVMIADDPEGFAAAVVELHADEKLWQTLSDQGLENVRRHFSPENARAMLLQMLSDPPGN